MMNRGGLGKLICFAVIAVAFVAAVVVVVVAAWGKKGNCLV